MATGKKNAKATKKFEKKHLKGVLEKRKAVATIKQRPQAREKKGKRSKDSEFYDGAKSDGVAARPKGGGVTKNVNEMSVDDFFQGGFEILEKDKKGKKAASGKLGKRKRDQPSAGGDGDDVSDSDASPEAISSEDGSDIGDEDDVGMSKAAMDALAKDDPEFYRFLKENDPEALDFDDDVELAGIDELSGSDQEEQPKKKRKKGKQQTEDNEEEADEEEADEEAEDEFAPKMNELTRPMISGWKKSIVESNSLRAARNVVIAFRCAAHLNEPEDEKKGQQFTISNPEVFHDVLVVALKHIPEVLQHHVPVKESSSGHVHIQTAGKKFSTLSSLIKSFTASILQLLRTLSDEGTLKLTLSSLEPILPYLLHFRLLLKSVIRTVVGFWSQPSSTESTRITAFLVLRKIVVIGDKAVKEAVLKAVYQGLIQGSRTTNPNTIAGINLMKNSAAELWGVDQGIGYTTAFTFIRQLAIHLRNSIVQKQKDSYKTIYNWQYVHSLDFWSVVLSEHCSSLKQAETGKESQLKLLIYPLVQVTLGAMRLIPTAIYFPLRFQLIRSLLRLSRATGTYIPLASPLLEVINSVEMKKPPRATTLKQFDFSISYKAPKSYLRTRVYQDGLGEQVVELFAEYFVLWATNIAFPEFCLPVVIMMKRWLKDARRKGSGNKNGKVISSLVLLVQKVEANAKFVEEKRARVDFAPRDRTQVDVFLKDFDVDKTPVGAFMVTQRRQMAERTRMMEEARKDAQRRSERDKAARRVEEFSDNEGSDDGAGLDEDDEEMEDEIESESE